MADWGHFEHSFNKSCGKKQQKNVRLMALENVRETSLNQFFKVKIFKRFIVNWFIKG